MTELKKRIIGYDIARALAIFGMVVVNFKIVMGAEQNGPTWLVNMVALLNGRAAATFVVLAGIGLSLLTNRARELNNINLLSNSRTMLLKRALFLFVVGLLYSPIWPADILHFYGIYIAVAVFFLTVSVPVLLTSSALLILAFSGLFFMINYNLGWNWDTLEYHDFWTIQGMIRHLFYNGFHPVLPWLAFLFIGMVIGRQDMSIARVQRTVFLWGFGVAVAAEAVSWLLIHFLSTAASPDYQVIKSIFGTNPMPPMPLYVLAGAGTASAIIAASVALGNRYRNAIWLRPFVKTGQIALTLYVAHVILGMGCLELIDRLYNQTLPFALLSALVFCITGVIFAQLWLGRFRRGPLEIIMRMLTEPKWHTTK